MNSVITIDGPSGSGKGTISRGVARSLGWDLLDSGALYRAVALAAIQREIELEDAEEVTRLARYLDIRFEVGKKETEVLLSGVLVGNTLRTEETGNAASIVAAIPTVREALLQRQRDFSRSSGLVADGRDMGTVVFPEACCKIFLTASAEERAKRREKQLRDKGIAANIDQLLKVIIERDDRDQNRSVAPLIAASDAHVIDSSKLSILEVQLQVISAVRRQCPC